MNLNVEKFPAEKTLDKFGKYGQGIGGVTNPNSMSEFEANPGHYPFGSEAGGKITFDTTKQRSFKGL